MSKMTTKAIVLFSGGQDSTTCLAQALADFPNAVEAVIIDYGQRHKIEITQAKKIAAKAKVPLHIITFPLLSQLTPNSLTHSDIPIDHQNGQLPSTFVPGRNHFFISIAAVIAYQKKITHIYTGVCQTDYSGYPDCRQNFIESLQTTLSLAMEWPIQIHTPLMYLTKAETIVLMQKLGKLHWYAETHTCYEGKRPACGKCPACLLRLQGFKESGVSDPLKYSHPDR
jgi:7-cyano-7-deazaguanine synthase